MLEYYVNQYKAIIEKNGSMPYSVFTAFNLLVLDELKKQYNVTKIENTRVYLVKKI